MRIPLAVVMLLITASCILPNPPDYAAPAPVVAPPPPGAPAALAPAPAPGPAVAVAPAEPVVPPAPELALYVPSPLGWFFPAFAPAPRPGRLTLSNFNYDGAHVQTLVTVYPDCQPRPDTAVSEFELPLNATRIVGAPPGSDVCWRRTLAKGEAETGAVPPTTPGWSEWNRVFTSSGRSIDSRL